MSNTHGGVNN